MRAVWLLLALAGACADRPNRHVMGLIALDDGTAVATWRAGDGYYYIGRIDETGEPTWTTRLAGSPITLLPSDGFMRDEESVSIRVRPTVGSSSLYALKVETFDLATGRRRWQALLGRYGNNPEDLTVGDSVRGVEPGRLLEVIPVEHGRELVELESSSGAVLARTDLPRDATLPTRVGDGWLVTVNDRLFEIQSGRVRQLGRTLVATCLTRDGHVFAPRYDLDDPGRRLGLVLWNRRDPMDPTDHPFDHGYLEACWSFRGRRFLLVLRNERRIVEVYDYRERPVARIQLDGDHHQYRFAIDEMHDATSPVTRFMPVVVRREDTERLVVLDLERLAIVSDELIRGLAPRIVRAGSRWYLTDSVGFPTPISVVDGLTGAKATTVIQADPRDFHSTSIGGQVLWMYSPEWWVGEMLVARLDAATLQPLHLPNPMRVNQQPME